MIDQYEFKFEIADVNKYTLLEVIKRFKHLSFFLIFSYKHAKK